MDCRLLLWTEDDFATYATFALLLRLNLNVIPSAGSYNGIICPFLAAKAQLNTCTYVLSVCPSVVKTEFLSVWSAYENL